MKKIKYNDNKKIHVRIFFDKKNRGSTQILKIFNSISHRDFAFNKDKIILDLDCGYAVVKNNGINVRWKNRKNEIRFCGAGAFALANYLRKTRNITKTKIYNKYISIDAQTKNNKSSISFKGGKIIKITGNLFIGKKDGIYFKRVHSIKELSSGKKILKEFSSNKKYNPHGLCVFYFDTRNALGYLRYFCPWHGRNEDSVTISIHKYLTPLLFKMTDLRKQKWQQLSKDGGVLVTEFLSKNIVKIYGTYREINTR